MGRIVIFIITWMGLIPSCFAFSMSSVMSSYYQSSTKLVTSLEERVVGYVNKTVDSLRYTSYKMGGSRFDPSKGVYILDCSNYVDQVLQASSPRAYLNLVNTTRTEYPTTQHYYSFFNELSDNPYWDKIENVENLKPGDIIVFRYKNRRRAATKGHIMVVMDKPISAGDGDSYLVRVADSAPSGHSQDTRAPHKSGIGIGTILLKANPKTGKPAAYAWRTGSCFKNHVNFAMARPISSDQHA